MSTVEPVEEFYEPPGKWGERYHLTRQTVYNLIAQGMPSIKIGRSRRIPVNAAHAWLMERGAR